MSGISCPTYQGRLVRADKPMINEPKKIGLPPSLCTLSTRAQNPKRERRLNETIRPELKRNASGKERAVECRAAEVECAIERALQISTGISEDQGKAVPDCRPQ